MKLKFKLFTAAFALLTIAAVYAWNKRPSLEGTAARAFDCFVREDGPCMYELTTVEEKEAYELTPEKWSALLQFLDSSSLKRGSAIEGLPDSTNQGLITRGYTFTDSSMKNYQISFTISKVGKQIQTPQIVSTAILLTAMRYGKPGVGPDGVDKLLTWSNFAKEYGSRLEQLGFRGFYQNRDVGLLSWVDFARYCEDRAIKVQEISRERAKQTQ